MTDLSGLPDFATLSSTATASTFAPFQAGSYAALPLQLVLATDATGKPKFQLDLVERAGDFSLTGQYAVVDFSLAGDFALDDALGAARNRDPAATVKPIAIASGFARLYPSAGDVVPTSDLLAPVPLGSSGPDYARWTARLSVDAGELIKGAIGGGTLLLGARVEFDAIGVAPRVAATVEFEPAALVAALLAGKSGRQIFTSDVLAAFTGAAQSFPLKILGGEAPSGDFAGAVASRLFAAFGTLAPSPGVADPPSVAFKDAAELGSSPLQWDLSQPALGRGQWVLTLDILSELRAAAARSGVDAFVRNVAVPALDVGFCNVAVNANLPLNRLGVPAIGAIARVAANPPLRPSSIAQTIAFSEPEDTGAFQFRISPTEQLAYTLAGFAVVAAGTMVQEYEMPPQPQTAAWVELGADDFPVAFAHVTAADRLLAEATLAIVLTYDLDGRQYQLQATLSAQAADVALAVPRSATGGSLSVTATPLDASAPLTLPPIAPGRIELDVTDFPEYGPHRVAIGAKLAAGGRPLVIDVIAQEQEGGGSAPDQLWLTADQPNATWGYVASSPFRAGYRYRTSASAGAPAGAWSPVLSPFTPVVLGAAGSAIAASANGTQPAVAPLPAKT